MTVMMIPDDTTIPLGKPFNVIVGPLNDNPHFIWARHHSVNSPAQEKAAAAVDLFRQRLLLHQIGIGPFTQ